MSFARMSNAITTPEDLNEGDHICGAEQKSHGLIREVGELPTHEMRYIFSLNDCPELKFVYTHKHSSLPWASHTCKSEFSRNV
jgi:hypothetical protein